MRRWPDSAWRMCRRTWRSRMWLKDASSECSRIGARLFRDTTFITRAAVTPHRHSPCWLMRCAIGINTKTPASYKILNEKFFEIAGLASRQTRSRRRTGCRWRRCTLPQSPEGLPDGWMALRLAKSNLVGVPLSCIRTKPRKLIAICSDAEVLGWFRKSVEKKGYRISGS